MKSRKITAKILRVRRKSFVSLRLSIVHNFRDGCGRATNEIIASFPTIRSTDVADGNTQRKFWTDANSTLERLKDENYYLSDLEEIKRRFAEVIPDSGIVVAMSKPKKINYGAAKIDAAFKKRFPLIKFP